MIPLMCKHPYQRDLINFPKMHWSWDNVTNHGKNITVELNKSWIISKQYVNFTRLFFT